MHRKDRAERDAPRRRCEVCSRVIRRRNKRFCSHRCQGRALKRIYERQRLALYFADKLNPTHTVDTGRVPRWVKRWWIAACGEQCAICGWTERHPVSGKVPLQWDHLDGDCSNNRHSNLRLLCPNCHALTATYGVLNYGKSKRRRKWAGVVIIQRLTEESDSGRPPGDSNS